MNKPISVLLTACGGSVGIDVARSLRASDLNLRIVGTDVTDYGIKFGALFCDTVLRIPTATEHGFLDTINNICDAEKIDVIIFNHSKEIREVGRRELKFRAKSLLPEHNVIRACSNKWVTVQKLYENILWHITPKGVLVNNPDQVATAFDFLTSKDVVGMTEGHFKERLERSAWIRPTEGSGARGAFLAKSPQLAKAWMKCWESSIGRPETWLMQEYLPGRNLSWQSVWHHGQLVVSALMERLGYYMGQNIITGVSGTISKARIIHDDLIDIKCGKAVAAVSDGRSHGIFMVDLKEAPDGHFKITEIDNRLSGRTWLHAATGRNLPEAVVRCLLGAVTRSHENLEKPAIGATIFRQMDVDPIIRYPDGRIR